MMFRIFPLVRLFNTARPYRTLNHLHIPVHVNIRLFSYFSSSIITKETMKDKLFRALNQTELTCRQRNAFEQHTLPRIEILTVSPDGLQSSFSIEVTQEMCHYDGGMIHAG